MLRPYRLLATVPHAPALMISCLVGRLQMPAIPLVLTFLIADWTDSYATGGVIGGALTLGQGIAGPVRGRAADRSSAPKLLVITGSCYAFGLALLAWLARPTGPLDGSLWWTVLPVALGTGLATPPISQLVRAIWPRIAEPPARDAAYAVESTMQELLFIIAPIVAATGVAVYGPVVATIGCAAWGLLGPLLFAAVLVRAGLREAPDRDPHRTESARLLRAKGFPRMLAFTTLLGAALVGTDLVLVSWARDRGEPELAGIFAAVWAVGSLIGGLLLGASSKPPRLWLRAAMAALGLVALVPVLPPFADPASPWIVGLVLALGGSAIAPTLAAAMTRVGELAPDDRRAEAFGWVGTAMMGGSVLASPLVGSLLDVSGPSVAAALLAGSGVLGVMLVAHHSVSGSPPNPTTEQSVRT